jgi:hypothetical protein
LLPTIVSAQTADTSGVINVYAKVIDIDSCENTLFVQTAKGFAEGDRILIIQMKGAKIDTADSPNFGTILDYGFSGSYEIARIKTIKGLFFTLESRMVSPFDVKGAVQIVRIPQYNNVNITGAVNARKWDGNVGGVVILEATGNVNLAADIDVSGQGFRGGDSSSNNAQPDVNNYALPLFFGEGGTKGEGIAHYVLDKEAGRGPQANGGGGGNSQNAGGGGGSNIGIGGIGGDQIDFFGRIPIGGHGGKTLNPIVPIFRVYMGGGGGGGQENDSRGSGGGTGGGIIIIRSATLSSSGGKLKANGANSRMAELDGGGGGGAGGSVLLEVGSATNNIPIEINGGDGADNAASIGTPPAWCYAPGGGGGGGVVIHPPAFTNISVSATGGAAGMVLDNTLSCFGTTYGADSGTSGGQRSPSVLPEGKFKYDRPNILEDQLTICEGDTVQLHVVGNVPVTWSPALGLDSVNSSTPLAFPTLTTTYVASMFKNSCTYLDSVRVKVNPRPRPIIAGANDPCGGSIVGYRVFPFTAGNTYLWRANGGSVIAGQSTDSVTIAWGNDTIFASLIIEMRIDSSGCIGTDSLPVVVTPTTLPPILGAKPLCEGDTIELSTPAVYSRYLWSNGDTTDKIRIADSGSFYVDILDGKCVQRSLIVRVDKYPPPEPDITVTSDSLRNPCDVVSMDAGAGYVAYLWSTGDSTQSIVVRDSGTYSVIVVDTNGCTGYDTTYIRLGILKPTKFILALDTLYGNTGDRVYYPIKIISLEDPLLDCEAEYTMSVHFNRSLIVPTSSLSFDSLTERLRFVTFGNTLNISGSITELPGIEFIVTLGDTSETPIVIDSFTWGKFPIEYIGHNGLFRLADICYEGGERLTDTKGLINISVPTPNPSSEMTLVRFSTIETGRTQVYLTDITGNTVRILADGEFKPGEYSVYITTNTLSAGNYFVTLRTPTVILHRGLLVDH